MEDGSSLVLLQEDEDLVSRFLEKPKARQLNKKGAHQILDLFVCHEGVQRCTHFSVWDDSSCGMFPDVFEFPQKKDEKSGVSFFPLWGH